MIVNSVRADYLSEIEEIETKKAELNETENTSFNNVKEVSIEVDSVDEEVVLPGNKTTLSTQKSGTSRESAEKKVEQLNKKLEKLEEKLENTDSEKKQEKLENQIEKIMEKIDYYEGLVDALSSKDKKLNALYEQRYKAEYEAFNTDSEKKQEKLENKIEKLDALIEERENFLNIDDDDIEEENEDNLNDDDTEQEDMTVMKNRDITGELMVSSDSKLQKLYDEFNKLENDYKNAQTQDEVDRLENELENIEDKIAKREEEIEQFKAGSAKLDKLNAFLNVEENLLDEAESETEKTSIALNIFSLQNEISDTEVSLEALK